MTDMPQTPTTALYDLPLFGTLLRLLAESGEARIWTVLLAVVALVALAVVSFGIKALGLIALAFVPVMFVILLTITVGK